VTTAGGGNRRLRSVRKLAGRSPFDEVEGWYEGVAAKKATDVQLLADGIQHIAKRGVVIDGLND
jgi:hypothetical protein